MHLTSLVLTLLRQEVRLAQHVAVDGAPSQR
jgi:hypothetical protein